MSPKRPLPRHGRAPRRRTAPRQVTAWGNNVGKTTSPKKPKVNARQSATVRRMYQAVGPDGKRQHTVAEIAEAVGVHRTTVYDYLNKKG